MELNNLNVKLSPEDLKELIELATEDLDKDTISLEEFRRRTDKWRMEKDEKS